MAKKRTVQKQTFSWNIKDIIPHFPEKGRKYVTEPFMTTHDQSLKLQIALWTDVLSITVLIEKPFKLPISAKFSVRFYLEGRYASTVYCSAQSHEAVDTKVTSLLHDPSSGVYEFAKISKWDTFRNLRLFLDTSVETRTAPDPKDDLLRSMYESGFGDCCLLVEKEPIRALKSILIHRSDYFRAMFLSGFKESHFQEPNCSEPTPIELPGLSHDSVVTCIRWMYTGDLPNLLEQSWPALRDLYITADMLQLELTKTVVDAIYHQHVTPSTFGEIFAFGQAHNERRLLRKALNVWGCHVVDCDKEDISEQKSFVFDSLCGKTETLDALELALCFNPENGYYSDSDSDSE
ncbi:60S ribosomal protein L11 [Quaeritorhiza haematococci]|nr:60S ribosomal protein L11 [Quaeritorhiza haematococci]